MTGVHQAALLRPTLLSSRKQVYFFIVAGTCADNMQSLKEIHAWADLELPLFITYFSRTMKAIKLKLDAHMDSGLLYRVYQIRAKGL